MSEICPFTLKEIPKDSLQIANVYNASIAANSTHNSLPACGHRCTLLPLVRHINGIIVESASKRREHDDQRSIEKKRLSSLLPLCPVCQHETIVTICDGISNSILTRGTSTKTVPAAPSSQQQQQQRRQEGMTSETTASGVLRRRREENDPLEIGDRYDFLFFKYGKQTYNIALEKKSFGHGTSSSSSWISLVFFFIPNTLRGDGDRNYLLAQDRIGLALGMNLSSLKILHKGRVLYPDQNRSLDDISQILVDISKSDLESCAISKKKQQPSLVVMGTLVGMELNIQSSNNYGTYTGIAGILQFGIFHLVGYVRGLVGAVYLFAKSMVYFPPQSEHKDSSL
mmetsp:Transcript_3617/g.4999  ORF Transcript_3617/g.4999 Transcript_3617/m.4999 type:complete len:341 (+) Transcript_3617:152-1174(+)|eukprot:CAMPEP_0184857076 /NCGR_PEP_ID=MMETSP0580-20130426/2246_1 /TAXON_ID=1118495 /ORGANISM="Dactyliosolen fragilissimus" /LENGTH=340 /DNA_ID=CAMNT_0027352465 /DNA_START=89 /DNA_END=1111 /DNA_ORIENTATION=-